MANKKGDILISVVIPALNEERYIGACLRSLKDQDFDLPYEVIVVDNGSTDATARVARHCGARIISQSVPGVCVARQTGTEQAAGEIIISTDADCEFPRSWLKNIYSAFLREGDAAAVFGPFLFTPIPRWGRWSSKMWFRVVKHFYNKKNKIMYVPAANFAFRKNIWSEIGGYNVNLAQGGDEYDLLKRLRQKGRVVYLPDNCIEASSRRLAKGIPYSLFIGLGAYYFLDYFIASRITGRSVFGQWRAFREPILAKKNGGRIILGKLSMATLIIVFFTFFVLNAGVVKAKSAKVFSRSKRIILNAETRIHHLEPSFFKWRFHKARARPTLDS